MNEHPFEQEQRPQEAAASQEEEGASSQDHIPGTREAVKEVFGAAKQAAKAARSDAEKAAQRAVPVAAKAARQGVYDIAYGAAFVAAFGVGVVSRLAPDSLKTGVNEGAVAGNKAALDLGKRSPADQADGDAVGVNVVPESGPGDAAVTPA
jgi:hypothetical protein